MNIIKSDKQPDRCPVCGRGLYDSKTRACSRDCVRTSSVQFIDASAHGGDPVPHCHVTCAKCGFEWLVEPADIADVKRLW